MPPLLSREQSVFDTQRGLALAEHFQVAYVTNDIDRACAMFRQRLGIRAFRQIGGTTPMGGEIRVELAWVGTVMYELMMASGPGSELYNGRLPHGEGFRIGMHHLGYLVHDVAQWDGAIARAKAEGLAVPYRNHNAGFMRACFVDVPELGHYLEYICPEPAGLDFFASVPRH